MEKGDGETQWYGDPMIRKANIICAALVGLGYLGDGILHFAVSWTYAVIGAVLLGIAVSSWRNWSPALLAAAWGMMLGVVTFMLEIMIFIAQRISVFGFFFSVLPAIFAAFGLLAIFFLNGSELPPSDSSVKFGLRVASAILAILVGVAYLGAGASHASQWSSGIIGLVAIAAAIAAFVSKRTDFLAAIWGFLLGQMNLDIYIAVSETISGQHRPNDMSPMTCAIMVLLGLTAAIFAVLASSHTDEIPRLSPSSPSR